MLTRLAIQTVNNQVMWILYLVRLLLEVCISLLGSNMGQNDYFGLILLNICLYFKPGIKIEVKQYFNISKIPIQTFQMPVLSERKLF